MTAGSTSYGFDAAGNVTSKTGVSAITTADDGTVTGVTTGSGTTTYGRDYRGLRLEKAGAGGAGTFMFDQAGNPIHWVGPIINQTCYVKLIRKVQKFIYYEDWVYLDGVRIAAVESHVQTACGSTLWGSLTVDDTWFFFNDKMGMPHSVWSDARGVQIWSADFDAFGVNIGTINQDPDGDGKSVTIPFRLPGQFALSTAEGGPSTSNGAGGLIENWNRIYDSGIGRYLEPDAEGQHADLSAYRYVGDRPLAGIDPAGRNIQVDTWHSGYHHQGIWITLHNSCCDVTGRQWWDFSPGTGGVLGAPGIIGNSYPGGNPDAQLYCTTCDQDRKALAAAQAIQASGMNYNVCTGAVCWRFVSQVLAAAGVTDAQKCGKWRAPNLDPNGN